MHAIRVPVKGPSLQRIGSSVAPFPNLTRLLPQTKLLTKFMILTTADMDVFADSLHIRARSENVARRENYFP